MTDQLQGELLKNIVAQLSHLTEIVTTTMATKDAMANMATKDDLERQKKEILSEQKAYTDKKLSEQQTHTDKKFEDQRAYTDKKFSEQQTYTDHKFTEQRENIDHDVSHLVDDSLNPIIDDHEKRIKALEAHTNHPPVRSKVKTAN